MFRKTGYTTALLLAAASLPAAAIQLDCQDNGDGTYICVEINQLLDTDRKASTLSEATEKNRPYIEQAKQECVYRKPRKVGGSIGSRAALNVEREKKATQEYERCLAQKANALRKEEESAD